MEELIRHISNAFAANSEEFLIEIRRLIFENEYSLNERTMVKIHGFFDEDECRPYLQFNIITDEVDSATEFYRYDFSRANQIKRDELEVLENNEVVVHALTLYQNDIVNN